MYINNELAGDIFNFSPSDCTFDNFPKNKQIVHYKKAETEFIYYYKKIEEVISIYKFGDVSVPGLSDLDFVIVLDKVRKHHSKIRYGINHFSANTQYILLHPQLFLNEDLMKNIYLCFSPSNLKRIWGKEIIFSKFTAKESHAFKNLMAVNAFLYKIPRRILKSLLTRKIKIRECITDLNNVKQYIEYFKNINCGDNNKFDEYLKDIEILKGSWFRNKEADNLNSLISCMKKSLLVSYHLISLLSKVLETEQELPMASSSYPSEKVSFKYNGDITYFEKDWNPDSSLNKTVDIFLGQKKLFNFLPLNYCFHLYKYVKAGGEFGNFISNQLIPRLNLSIDNNDMYSKRRAEFINSHIDFVKKNGIKDSASFFYLGYNPKIENLEEGRNYYKYKKCILGQFKRFKDFVYG